MSTLMRWIFRRQLESEEPEYEPGTMEPRDEVEPDMGLRQDPAYVHFWGTVWRVEEKHAEYKAAILFTVTSPREREIWNNATMAEWHCSRRGEDVTNEETFAFVKPMAELRKAIDGAKETWAAMLRAGQVTDLGVINWEDNEYVQRFRVEGKYGGFHHIHATNSKSGPPKFSVILNKEGDLKKEKRSLKRVTFKNVGDPEENDPGQDGEDDEDQDSSDDTPVTSAKGKGKEKVKQKKNKAPKCYPTTTMFWARDKDGKPQVITTDPERPLRRSKSIDNLINRPKFDYKDRIHVSNICPTREYAWTKDRQAFTLEADSLEGNAGWWQRDLMRRLDQLEEYYAKDAEKKATSTVDPAIADPDDDYVLMEAMCDTYGARRDWEWYENEVKPHTTEDLEACMKLVAEKEEEANKLQAKFDCAKRNRNTQDVAQRMLPHLQNAVKELNSQKVLLNVLTQDSTTTGPDARKGKYTDRRREKLAQRKYAAEREQAGLSPLPQTETPRTYTNANGETCSYPLEIGEPIVPEEPVIIITPPTDVDYDAIARQNGDGIFWHFIKGISNCVAVPFGKGSGKEVSEAEAALRSLSHRATR